ncbi:hypothetical protein Dimus_013283 [Dionaea muscipula]
MTVTHLKKKDIVKSSVKGVAVEFDHEKLASILGILGNNGICEYVKDVWEESKYIKPLEITRSKKSSITEMKPFQRFVHFIVMKNIVPRFGKRDITSFMDLTYMDHLVNRRRINALRVMMRHMAYVISVKDHELPYGDWMTMVFEAFGVPLVNKKGSGENRRRDDAVDVPEGEAEEEEERNQGDFDWEVVVEEAAVEGESSSGEKFYDAEDKDQGSLEVNEEIPTAAPQSSAQQKEQETSGVDPSCPTGRIHEVEMTRLQAEFERKRANRFLADLEKAKAENARLLALLHQAQSKPNP